MEKPSIIKSILTARRVSVPIVGITSPDQLALTQLIRESVNGSMPLLRHDVIRGAVALNEPGTEAIISLGDHDATVSPIGCLDAANMLPAGSILIMQNAHRWLADQGASQAVLNLRDVFKSDQRMLILLAPGFSLPGELVQDVVLFDEELPDRTAIGAIVTGIGQAAGLELGEDTVTAAAESLVGLSPFAAEQSCAMALTKDGLSIDECWQRKRKQVEQTKGLSMASPTISYKDVGGLESVKGYFGKLFAGPAAPRLLVFLDEVEKLMAGSFTGAGDNTGVSQDFLQVLLDRIERHGWLGALALGPGGSGKSYFAEALAGQMGIKSIRMDTGAMKSSALGDSEQSIRAAMNTVHAIGGNQVLIFATCNGLQELRPELQRRLASAGMWYFDLPTDEEKENIWAVQCSKFSLPCQARPIDKGWSSSDIRDCCRTAFLLGETLIEASIRVNSAMSREAERIESLRRLASGRFSSASYPGAYRYQSTVALPASGKGRAVVSMEEL